MNCIEKYTNVSVNMNECTQEHEQSNQNDADVVYK